MPFSFVGVSELTIDISTRLFATYISVPSISKTICLTLLMAGEDDDHDDDEGDDDEEDENEELEEEKPLSNSSLVFIQSRIL